MSLLLERQGHFVLNVSGHLNLYETLTGKPVVIRYINLPSTTMFHLIQSCIKSFLLSQAVFICNFYAEILQHEKLFSRYSYCRNSMPSAGKGKITIRIIGNRQMDRSQLRFL